MAKKTEAELVKEYDEKFDYPLKAEVEVLRNIIKSSNSKIKERIKWNAFSYYYKDYDMAAFNFRDTNRILIVFVFPKGLVEDTGNILEGDYTDRRLAYFSTMEEIKSKKETLQKIVNDWIHLIDKSNIN